MCLGRAPSVADLSFTGPLVEEAATESSGAAAGFAGTPATSKRKRAAGAPVDVEDISEGDSHV